MRHKQRVLGAVLSYIHLISNILINLIYVPILIKGLGDSEYGLYQLMGSFIAYFAVFDFGLSNSTIRFYSLAKVEKNVTQKERVASTSFLIFLIISGFCIIAGLGVWPLIDSMFTNSLNDHQINEAKIIFLVQIINIVISLLGKAFNATIISEERFVFLKLMSIIQCYIQPIVVYAIIREQPYAITVVYIQTVFNVLMNIIMILYATTSLRVHIQVKYYDKNLARRMLGLSMSVFIVAITDQLFWKTNQFILGATSGTIAVAIYSVASQIYMNYMTVSSMIQGLFLPKVTEMVASNDSDGVNNLFIVIGRIQYMLLSLILIGFACTGKEFILLWVGDKYIDAYWISLIIIFAMTVDLIQSIGSTVLQAQNRYGVRAMVLSVAAAINVIGALSVAKSGGIACALVSAICMLIANGPIMNVAYKKVAKLDIGKYWSAILLISKKLVWVLVLGILVNLVPLEVGLFGSFALKAATIIIAYFAIMNSEVKGIIALIRK